MASVIGDVCATAEIGVIAVKTTALGLKGNAKSAADGISLGTMTDVLANAIAEGKIIVVAFAIANEKVVGVNAILSILAEAKVVVLTVSNSIKGVEGSKAEIILDKVEAIAKNEII